MPQLHSIRLHYYGLVSLQVAQGLIYVWPEAGPQADAEAWSQKPHLLPWISEKVRFGRSGRHLSAQACVD